MAEKCWVAVSGGVDSAVSMLLLKESGYDISGITMVQFGNDLVPAATDADIADARSLCEGFGANHTVVHLEKEFRESVIKSFVESYAHGETPNPCVICNKYIKFGALADYAFSAGADLFATGHYVRTVKQGERKVIARAKCAEKDQSYMLWMLSCQQLRRFIAPLGDMTKEEVRAYAESKRISVAHKSDSQDICFIPDGDYRAFLDRVAGVPDKPGAFIHTSGKTLGTHLGQRRYTVGQRKGLGVSYSEPLYVVGRDIAANTVILGANNDLFRNSFLVRNANFSACEPPLGDLRCSVRIRYHAPDVNASVSPAGNGTFLVRTDTPVRAVTPGQSAVFYDGDILIGGGIISECQAF